VTYIPIVGLISLMVGLLNACCPGWGWKVISWSFARGRARNLTYLQKRRARLSRLHDSDREYYGRLLSGVLSVLALFAVEIAFEGLMGPPKGISPEMQLFSASLLNLLRYGLGLAAYLIAMARLGDYWTLQRFDRTMATLDYRIATLETKQSLQPAPAGL
jgi:hypothetical protein